MFRDVADTLITYEKLFHKSFEWMELLLGTSDVRICMMEHVTVHCIIYMYLYTMLTILIQDLHVQNS